MRQTKKGADGGSGGLAAADDAASVRTTRSAGSASIAGLRYEKEASGHTLCAVCKSNSRSHEWAAQRSDGDTLTPLGNLCKLCYEVFELKKSREMPDLDSFVRRAAASKAFRGEVEKTKLVKAGAGVRDFDNEGVVDEIASSFEVIVPYVCLNEKDMLRYLSIQTPGLSRVPKYMVEDCVTMELPAAGDATRTEQHYIFRHPQRPFKELEVRSVFGLRRRKDLMTQAMLAGHGNNFMSAALPKTLDTAGAAAVADKAKLGNLPTLEEFLLRCQAKLAKCRVKPKDSAPDEHFEAEGSDGGDSGDGAAATVVSGPAAEHVIAAGGASSSRRVPQVPMFSPAKLGDDEVSMVSGSPGGIRKAASVGSGGTVEDDEEDDDYDQRSIQRLEGAPMCH